MGDKNQAKIIKHHIQVDDKKLRDLKKQYDRDHRYNEKKQAGLILKQQYDIACGIFKVVYMICLITILLSALIYAIGEIYGF